MAGIRIQLKDAIADDIQRKLAADPVLEDFEAGANSAGIAVRGPVLAAHELPDVERELQPLQARSGIRPRSGNPRVDGSRPRRGFVNPLVGGNRSVVTHWRRLTARSSPISPVPYISATLDKIRKALTN